MTTKASKRFAKVRDMRKRSYQEKMRQAFACIASSANEKKVIISAYNEYESNALKKISAFLETYCYNNGFVII